LTHSTEYPQTTAIVNYALSTPAEIDPQHRIPTNHCHSQLWYICAFTLQQVSYNSFPWSSSLIQKILYFSCRQNIS